ncbi:uncharacterized protein IL334_003925 [Kwoniella shivajii]|uniref:Uncharacterized protein n=1 Tax=Kwoniella shivajii TaxID=564305 RepID=A0ABZ1CZA2_9TREE|nr:hypothetical protein IL334_003925 [Kwoniella shivajii]
MGTVHSRPKKLTLDEIPEDAKSESKYTLYIMMTYREGSERGPNPLWTGSYDDIIHQEIPPNSAMYGWGSSQSFDKEKVRRFVKSLESKNMDVEIRYRVVGPSH